VRVYSGVGALLQTITGVTSTTQALANLTTKTAYQVDVTAVSNAVSGVASNKSNFTTI